MADQMILLKENFVVVAMSFVGWSMLSWLGLWNVVELFVVTLSIGFVLGYVCAGKVERARRKVIPVGTQIGKKSTSTVGTQSKGPPKRSIGAQSQCTYKRQLVTPRFQLLPQLADGVFDVSFSD